MAAAADDWNDGGSWGVPGGGEDADWGVGGNAAVTGGSTNDNGEVRAREANDNWAQQGSAGAAGDGAEAHGTETGGMTCRRCGEVGHIARECPKERDDSDMVCRGCNQIGHAQANCPDAKCRRCDQTGHKAIDCTNLYNFPERKALTAIDPGDAWKIVEVAASDGELNTIMLKRAFHLYSLSAPSVTYQDIEQAFRDGNFPVYLVAIDSPQASVHTLVDIQGNIDRKYKLTIQTSLECPRKRQEAAWPKTEAENLKRLANAGVPYERHVPYCTRCKELGHTSKNCKEEASTDMMPKIICVHCNEQGHRARDCTQPRKVYKVQTCRNCGEEGHKKEECENETNMDLVTCRNCDKTGHFGKDCPDQLCKNCGEPGHISKECTEPRSNKNMTCRNCDEVGHISKECTKPRDYTRMKCSNCSQMGHGRARCPNPAAEPDDDGEDGGVYIGHLINNSAPEPTNNGGDEWNTGAATDAW